MNILEARRRTLGKGVYKKTVEGNPAIAQGSLARMYPGITMQGWTEQDGTPTPENPVPIVSAGNWNEETQKWEYEVKLTGANLFDISKVITRKGLLTNNGDGTLTATPKTGDSTVTGLAPNTLRGFCPDLISGKTYRLTANTTGSFKLIFLIKAGIAWSFGLSKVVTDDMLDSVVAFYASGANTEAVISDIMITEVENADYEPYRTPQTVLLTSDRPLTKWDKLEKRNGQWGWVYKSAEIESYTDESVPGEYFSTTGQLSTGAQVWYETTTETFVPLSESEQEQMNALHTFRPTTVLSNDCDCNMTLTYKTKKSLEVAT